MDINAQETFVAARVNVYLAPVGTEAPADESEALDPAWKHVGLTTPDSLSVSDEPEFGQIDSHQSDYPVRRFKTSTAGSVSVDLLQWNSSNLKAVHGGGTITEVGTAGSGHFKFVPPDLTDLLELSAIIEVIDGTKKDRYVYVRTMQVEGVQKEFQKGQAATLPLRLAVLGDDAGEPWYLLSNHLDDEV